MAKIKKGKWAIWKTIVVVFSSIALVAGATVGGVYLAGGFKEQNINPESINFVIDNPLYNTSNGQFEVTENFMLTVTSPTEKVTKSSVSLSFGGDAIIHHNPIARTISDGTITVPEIVKLNEPFEVKLNQSLQKFTMKNDEGEEVEVEESWVSGGISKLIAKSEYDKALPATTQIAVDVPVHNIDVSLFDANGQEVVDGQITSNETFTAKAVFYPAASKYQYSDNHAKSTVAEESWRVKSEYFSVSGAGNIEFRLSELDEAYFQAGDRKIGDNKNYVYGYVFKTAAKQTEIQEFYKDYSGEQFYTTIHNYLATDKTWGISNAIAPTEVEVVEATIGGFSVTRAGDHFADLINGVAYRVSMNRDDDSDNYLGAMIHSTKPNQYLTSPLKYVAIEVEYSDGLNSTTNEEIWKVADNDRINVLGRKIGDNDYVEIDGRKFYLPNINVTNLNSAYFDLTAKVTGRYRLNVVLLEYNLDADGKEVYSIYNPKASSNFITMQSQEATENSVQWNRENPITITLNYNGSTPEPSTYLFESTDPLTGELTAAGMVPSTNRYQEKIYFAYFGAPAAGDIDRTQLIEKANSVLGEEGYSYAGEYFVGGKATYLFPLRGKSLTVKTSEVFKVYFATVETNRNGYVYEKDHDGNVIYKLVRVCETPLDVNVVKSLYDGSVKGVTASILNYDGDENLLSYFIYAGSPNSINLSIEVNADSQGVFNDKLGTANAISLQVLDEEGDVVASIEQNPPAMLREVTDEETNSVKYFADYLLQVPSGMRINGDVKLSKIRIIDTTNNMTWERNIIVESEDKNQIVIYTPKVNSSDDIKIANKENYNIDLTKNITVNQTLDTNGEFQTTIDFTDKNGQPQSFVTDESGTAIDKLHNSISVIVTDNHGNTNSFAHSWVYTTESTVVEVAGQSFTFASGENATAEVYVNCGQVTSNSSLKFVISSTGIESVEYDPNEGNETSIKPFELSASNKDVSVRKYGNVNREIELKDLVKLYLDKEKTREFTNFFFYFNEANLTELGDDLIDLFGENGMLSVEDINGQITFDFTNCKTNDEKVNVIKDALSWNQVGGNRIARAIKKIVVNKEFAKGLEFKFKIHDMTKAVDINLTLAILQNVSIGADVSVNEEVNAAEAIGLQGSVNCVVGSTRSLISKLGALNGYKIVATGTTTQILVNGNLESFANCKLVAGNMSGVAIATIQNNGEIVFEDFWDKETKYFRVKLDLEQNPNSYTLYTNVDFIVTRNVKFGLKNENAALKLIGGANNVNDFFTWTRLDGTKFDGDLLNQIIVSAAEDSGFVVTDGNINVTKGFSPLFDLRKNEAPTINFELKVKGNVVASARLPYISGVTNNEIAGQLKMKLGEGVDDALSAKLETLNGKDYVFVQNGDYEVSNIIAIGEEGKQLNYNFAVWSRVDVNNETYSVDWYEAGTQDVDFASPQSTAILGLSDDDSIYMIVIISQNGERRATILIPLLISNIGVDLINYTNIVENDAGEKVNENVRFNTLENALSDATKLKEKGIWQEVTAGELLTIGTKLKLGEANGNFGFNMLDSNAQLSYTYGIAPRFTSNDNLYYTDIINDFIDNDNNKDIQLNHMSKVIAEGYVAVRVEVSNGSWHEYLFFLLKVKPDTTVKAPTYPFNNGKENLSGVVNEIIGGEQGIDLDNPFGEGTIAQGQHRFNVEVDGKDDKYNKSLAHTHEVVSVSVAGGRELTTKAEYDRYIDIQFDGSVMRVTPKTTATITLKIKRVYGGGSTLSIVGGEIEYIFEINANVNYSLQYSNNSTNTSITTNPTSPNNATWNVDATVAGNQAGLKVKLINNTVTTGAVGSEVQGQLNHAFYVIEKDENGKDKRIEWISGKGGITNMTYDNNSFDLNFTRNTYVASDQTIVVIFYTQYGSLGELKIVNKASAKVEYKKNGNALVADAVYAGDYTLDKFVDVLIASGGEYKNAIYTIASATQIAGDYKLFKLNGQTLQFFPSIRDEEIRIQIALNDVKVDSMGGGTNVQSENDTFTFELAVKVKKDIVQVGNDDAAVGITQSTAQIISRNKTGTIFAGDSVRIDVDEIMNFNHPANSSKVESEVSENFDRHILYTWADTSTGDTSPIVRNDALAHAISIQTNNVGKDGANVTALITAYLFTDTAYEEITNESGEKVTNILVTESKAYAKFYIKYSFKIMPNVRIEVSYPNPTKTSELEAEYLKTEARFEKPYDFVNGNATLSNSPRISIVPLSDTEKDKTQNFTVKVQSLQNATIYTGGVDDSSRDITPTEGKNLLYNSEWKEESQTITFRMGSRNTLGDIVVGQAESHIVLEIECNGVTEIYNIILQESIFGLSTNPCNQNDEFVETIYVDKITEDTILAKDRLIKFTVKDTATNPITATSYVLVFEKIEKQGGRDVVTDTKYYPLRKLSATDVRGGRTLAFDYGNQDLSGYTYKGTYANNDRNFKYNDNGVITGFATEEGTSEITATPMHDDDLYSAKPRLASRIEMYYYAGEERILVDYSYLFTDMTFGSYFDGGNAEQNKDEGLNLNAYKIATDQNSMGKVVMLGARKRTDPDDEVGHFTFNLNNGQNNGIEQFSTTYKYKTALDIDVLTHDDGYAAGENGLRTIAVGDNVNLIESNGVYHPSTGEPLSRAELLAIGAPTINLQIVGITVQKDDLDIDDNVWNRFLSKYPNFEQPYYKNNSYRYISLAPVNEDGQVSNDEMAVKVITDVQIRGMGAGNGGNYVLLYFTYSKTIDEKTYKSEFFLPYKVEPDYTITYSTTTKNDEDENHVQSNINAPYMVNDKITDADNNDIYKTLHIAGSTDNANPSVVRVRTSTASTDVAASRFKYTLTTNQTVGSTKYNDEGNVVAKLNSVFSAGQTNGGWGNLKPDSGNNQSATWTYNAVNATECTLQGMKTVYIGSQDYQLVAEDDYGYKFQVYFRLNSGKQSPSVSGTFTITENEKFDLGVHEYEQLSIETDGNNVDIVPAKRTNSSTQDFKMLNIRNVEAWGFVEDPISISNPILKFKEGKYSLIDTNNKIATEDEKYLNAPNVGTISIDNISFFDSSNKPLVGIEYTADNQVKDDNDDTKKKLVESEERLATRATSGSEFIFEGVNFTGASARFQMPKLPAEAYKENSVVTVTMVITLRYGDGSNSDEYFEIKVPTTVTRDVRFINPVNNIVRDGAEFDISDYITAYKQNGKEYTIENNVTYYDDTLKVTLPGNSSMTFSLTRERNVVEQTETGEVTKEETKTTAVIPVSNMQPYAMTIYRSISSLFGETSKVGDKITINVISHGTDSLGQSVEKTKVYGFYIEYGGNSVYANKEGNILYKGHATITKPTENEKLLDGNGVVTIFSCDLGTLAQIISNKDKINIIDSQRLAEYDIETSTEKYSAVPVNKYYIAELGTGENVVGYQVAREYNVSRYYNHINGTDNVLRIDNYLKLEKTDNEKTTTTYMVPKFAWGESLAITIPKREHSGVQNVPFDTFSKDSEGKLHYTISGEDGSSGAAKVDPTTGLVTTTENYDISEQHFILHIYMKASGLDGQFSNEISKYDKLIGEVTFMLVENTSMQTIENVAGQKVTFQNNGLKSGKYGLSQETIDLTSYADYTVYAKKVDTQVFNGQTTDSLGRITIKNVENITTKRYYVTPSTKLYSMTGEGDNVQFIDVTGATFLNAEVEFTPNKKYAVLADGFYYQEIYDQYAGVYYYVRIADATMDYWTVAPVETGKANEYGFRQEDVFASTTKVDIVNDGDAWIFVGGNASYLSNFGYKLGNVT